MIFSPCSAEQAQRINACPANVSPAKFPNRTASPRTFRPGLCCSRAAQPPPKPRGQGPPRMRSLHRRQADEVEAFWFPPVPHVSRYNRMKRQQQPHPAFAGVAAVVCLCLHVRGGCRPGRCKVEERTQTRDSQHHAKTMFTEHILTFMSGYVKRFSNGFDFFTPLRRRAGSAPALPRRAGRISAARRTL